MPRQARIDGAGALHHIICRGIERKEIFSDDLDRKMKGQLSIFHFWGRKRVDI